MKRIIILSVMVLLLGLLMATPALAVNVYTHGDFASNSKGCADCHITHGANAAKLLVAGPTQTDTCYFCHGEASWASRYDAETGRIMGTDGSPRPSYAGGFKKSVPNPNTWTVASLAYNTSVHSVEKAWQTSSIQAGQVLGKDIPGGTLGWTSEFTCGTCHDPHAGGRYPAVSGYINPRLLKLRPNGATVDKVVYMRIDYDYSADNSESKTLMTLEYGKGFNAWCGACHDKFNTEGTGTENPNRTGSYGIDNGAGQTKYRHKMGVMLTSTSHSGFSTSLTNGLPLPTNTTGARDVAGTPTNYLMCLSCHRAHGSAVTVSVGFKRFRSYDTIYGSAKSELSVNDGASALLRLPERDVCYKCHGAAQYNIYSGTDKYGVGY